MNIDLIELRVRNDLDRRASNLDPYPVRLRITPDEFEAFVDRYLRRAKHKGLPGIALFGIPVEIVDPVLIEISGRYLEDGEIE